MNEPAKLVNLSIDLLTSNKKQPRKVFNDDTLEELALSIKKHGILNPILVRTNGEKYEIISGERRYRAAKLAGLKEIPAIIKNIDDTELLEISLIENIQRENISPIEEAKSFESIINASQLPQENLSNLISKPQSYISNKIKLMNLPQNIQEALALRKISEKHARLLLMVEDTEKQTELLDRIINEKLTVKELDNIINEKKITEEEIQNAISDIMKSLNIATEEKEEEKESDNMNNGNFFPNMNQNIQPEGQPMAPNTMNIGIPPMQEAPVPQPMTQMEQNPIPNFGAPAPQVEVPSQPTFDIPNFNNDQMTSSNLELPQGAPIVPNTQPEPQSMPQMDMSMPPVQETPVPQMEVNPIPDFGAPITPEPVSIPMSDVPLFNSEANMIPQPEVQLPVASSFEVPVATSPMTDNSQKLTQIQELLNSNGIEYKSYSNETGHCIIIEL